MKVADEVAKDDPPRYSGTTLIGQAFEAQWERMAHDRAAKTAHVEHELSASSSGTEQEASQDGGIKTQVFHRPNAKKARVDPYVDFEAVGLGAAGRAKASAQASSNLTPSEADEPTEVHVDSDSDSSCSSQCDDEIPHLQDSAFSSLLRDMLVRSSKTCLSREWDNGLSSQPLFSFYHKKTRCRHWSYERSKPVHFLCHVAPNPQYSKGGELHMDWFRSVQNVHREGPALQ